MSGGHWEYQQYKIEDIATSLDRMTEHGAVEYPPDIIESFREAAKACRRAFVMVHRIDWLVCGDDDVDSYRSRLKEQLEKLE